MKFVQIYLNKYTFYEFKFSTANIYDLYSILYKTQNKLHILLILVYISLFIRKIYLVST